MRDFNALLRAGIELATARLGDRVICQACGATVKTMEDLCSAPFEPCQGFTTYDAARSKALEDVGFFKGERP